MAEVVPLGWQRMPLDSAVAWLSEAFGADLSDVLVATPGARSGRRLSERLARRLGPSWRPPRVVTAGALTDLLVDARGAPAGRLARTVAWARALHELPRADLELIVARAPDEHAFSAWWRLAERIRGLFGELAADGQSFIAAARATAAAPTTPRETLFDLAAEDARWHALARAQERTVELLRAAGQVDPHLARLEAIETGRVADVREVVLVGVVDMNGLLRRALEALEAADGARLRALVFAPEERRGDFDELGCLRPEPVVARGIDLPLERWHVVGGADDQAERTLDVVAGWGGRYAAEEITVGAADREVVPYLARRFESVGVRARDAAGTPLAATRPMRLLTAAGSFLARRTFGDFAALVRHPDLEASMRRGADLEPARLVDEYHLEHLPARVPEGADPWWLGDEGPRMKTLYRAVRERLGALADEGARPVPDWAPPLRSFLLAIYGAEEFAGEPTGVDDDDPSLLAAALRALGDGLAELERLPAVLAPEVPAADAIELLSRVLAGRSVPPAAARPGEPTVELLGWLELPLDDAPALVVTGFEDGKIPEALHGDAFLPDSLRQRLGLVDNQRRLARDLHATELLLRTREEIAFVSGRWNRLGDPALASRIAFHGEEASILEHVDHFLADVERRRTRERVEPPPARELPRAGVPPLETMSVTSFKAWLESPYRYYVERMLRLEVVSDAEHEMDPLRFGDLTHKALEAFGRDEGVGNATDAAQIHEYLTEEVRRLARQRFGDDPLPAVALQLAQLEYRLGAFARQQARRAAEGWRIEHVEWRPAAGQIQRVVDGKPIRITGRIDRIDLHADGRWAIWDYKTGERVRPPGRSHYVGGKWRDLQLPLYWLLTRELGHDGIPTLGLVSIAKDQQECRFLEASGWDEGVLESGLAVADDVVRAIRRGELFDPGDWKPYEPTFQALLGVGLVARSMSGAAEGSEEGGA